MDNPDLGTPVSQVTPDLPGSYFSHAILVFVLAVTFSLALSSYLAFFALSLAYGVDAANVFLRTNSYGLSWVYRGVTIACFFGFYLIGKRLDFGRRYVPLTILAFVGVLAGQLPLLIFITETSSQGVVTSTGYVFSTDPGTIVQAITTAFERFAIPVAGLALAFFLKTRLPSSQQEAATAQSSEAAATAETKTDEGQEERFAGLPQIPFILGFALVTLSYIASAVVDVVGSRFPVNGPFEFLRTTFVTFSPYDSYAYDFFYPLLFFIVFYFLGRRLDIGRSGLKSFALSVFVAGALGFLLGVPLANYIRSLAAPPGHAFPIFAFEPAFFRVVVVDGLNALALGFAASSLGFIRNIHAPINHDRWIATALIFTTLLLFTFSMYLAVSSSASGGGTVTIVTKVSSSTYSSKLP